MSVLYKTLFILFAISFLTQKSHTHCQIPCGRYDDPMRIAMLLEHAKTIEKSVNELLNHEKDRDVQTDNQRVRWVLNKEEYANKIIHLLSDYFLTQRIKPSNKSYVDQLKAAHKIMLLAVTCKQTVDLKTVRALDKAIQAFAVYYPAPKHQH